MSEIIQDLSLEDVLGDRFGRYSKYIIQERALPDVPDGFKTSTTSYFTMQCIQVGNTHDKISVKVRKQSVMLLVNIIHMETPSVYEAMVRLSQDWKLDMS